MIVTKLSYEFWLNENIHTHISDLANNWQLTEISITMLSCHCVLGNPTFISRLINWPACAFNANFWDTIMSCLPKASLIWQAHNVNVIRLFVTEWYRPIWMNMHKLRAIVWSSKISFQWIVAPFNRSCLASYIPLIQSSITAIWRISPLKR